MDPVFLNLVLAESGLEVGFGERGFSIPHHEVHWRNRCCQEVIEIERNRGADFLSMASTPKAVRRRWEQVLRWDFERVVRPVVQSHRERATGLLYDAVGPLLSFSARRAVWQGILDGQVHPSVLESLMVFPVWGGAGLVRLAESIEHDDVPVVRPRSLLILVGTLPSALEDDLLLGLQREQEDDERPLAEIGEELLEDLSEPLQEDLRVHALLRELVALSSELGCEIVLDCDRATFVDAIVQGPSHGTLILVTHQDERGVHFADGPLELDTIRCALAPQRGRNTWSGFLSMVCGSSASMNLAHCMQSVGVPVVMTHGWRTFRGVSLGALLIMLRGLRELGPVPLCRLVDYNVSGLSWTQRRRPPSTNTE